MEQETRPYPPGWLDRFTDWVRQLPVPSWLFYLLLGLTSVLAFTGIKWGLGVYPVGQFRWMHILSGAATFYVLALVHYLDNTAAASLHHFRPAMRIEEAEFRRLSYSLTTLPARPTLLATLGGLVFGAFNIPIIVSMVAKEFQLFTGPVDTVTDTLTFLSTYAVCGVLIYHTVRQLNMISYIYTRYANIDLFNLAPLYSLSRQSARTAIGVSLLGTGAFAGFLSVQDADAFVVTTSLLEYAVLSLLILVTFVWPLWGAHSLLEKEKEKLQTENAQQIKSVISEIHRRRDEGDNAEMAALNHAMEALVREQSVLDKIPTWPWQPGTLRGVGTAILLPVVLWFITRLLERFVAF
jgi:hypothetical protein